MASIGASRAALNAGYKPNVNPTITDANTATAIVLGDTHAYTGAFVFQRMNAETPTDVARPSAAPSTRPAVETARDTTRRRRRLCAGCASGVSRMRRPPAR